MKASNLSSTNRNKTFPGKTITILLFIQATLVAQNLIQNSGFETGMKSPDGWEILGCSGEWSSGGYEGKMVSVFGNSKNSGAWYSPLTRIKPGGIYHFIFMGRREIGTTGGCAIAGTRSVNRDFQLSDEWQELGYYFKLPDIISDEQARVGHWQIAGMYYFDNIRMYPSIAVHKKISGDIELGEGEYIITNRYFFNADYGWKGANYHRPLLFHTCGFNSDRWTFAPEKEVLYRFKIGETEQTDGILRVSLNYYVSGDLEFTISKDQKVWIPLGVLNGKNRSARWQLPSNIFPASQIFIKLKCAGKEANLQLNTFEYQASISKQIPDCFGETYFMDIFSQSPEFEFTLNSVGFEQLKNRWRIDFTLIYNGTNKISKIIGECYTGAELKPEKLSINIPRFKEGENKFNIKHSFYFVPGGANFDVLTLVLKDENGKVLFTGLMELNPGILNDPRPGYWLAENSSISFWWCESGWKIGRNRGTPQKPPSGKPEPIRISCARGEYEAAQLILSPSVEGEILSVYADFSRSSKSNMNVFNISFYEVAYVAVTHPTDSSASRGLYPDPLPPLKFPLRLAALYNQPIWINVKVPEYAFAGMHEGSICLKTSYGEFKLPIIITVYDFSLPGESHLRSAFGLSTASINSYHKLKKQEDKELVYEKYLKNFAQHRISPYSFFDYHPIKISFTGEGTNKQSVVDFSRFDVAAEKWLNEHGFNSFRLPLKGMGGGTFQSRFLGSLEGFKEGTIEHARLFRDYLSKVEEHLRQRGWLGKAYTYWFDEPDKKDYEFVVEGMKRIKTAAPGLKRLLTEQPEPELIGHVDIWCGLTPEWNKKLVEICKNRGEEVWWYICCGPRAPYITEFIDHPGTELRLWPWQSWQFGVQGILVWETTYWTSSCAYTNKLQNPWDDPMSYVSGYDFPPGYIGYWGNGDGRFLYPPRRDPNFATEPCLDEPVNSIRWEMLRDGMEDYEYFWLLSKQCERIAKKQPDHPLLKKAQRLLEIPENISANLTKFTTDPREILQYREKIARMIEQLQRL